MSLTILCAEDAFITAQERADQSRLQLAEFGDLDIRTHSTGWPDEPFGDVGSVREAAGDPAEIGLLAKDVEVIVTHLAPITAQVTRNIGAGSRGLAGKWDGKYFRYGLAGPELGKSTIGLIGFGAIGAHVTTLLLAFGARVLVHDPYTDAKKVSAAGAEPLELDKLLAAADIVSLHAWLTAETTGMASAAFFAKMAPGSFFIDHARGELVRTEDLTAALQQGHLAGAALDVFDPEPPPADHPLLALESVVATPHLAGSSRQVAQYSAATVVAEVRRYLRDGTLSHCANPSVLR